MTKEEFLKRTMQELEMRKKKRRKKKELEYMLYAADAYVRMKRAYSDGKLMNKFRKA